jgi:cell division protein FtsI/penicillin-binding protein 2
MYDRSVRVIICLFLLLIGAFLALAGRCFYLQFFKGDHYLDVCLRQQRSFYPQKPQRGVILDRCGRVLAASNRIAIIFAEPRLIADPKTTSNKLAPIVGMGAHEVCKLIIDGKNPGFVKIKAGVDEEKCRAASRINGIGVQYDWLRHYPIRRLAAHTVGFISLDGRGLGGVEFQYNAELNGSSGQDIFLADVHRRPIKPLDGCGYDARLVERQTLNVTDTSRATVGRNTQHSEDGCGIILTLDAAIQEFARTELMKQHEIYQAESAVAIVADPTSGAILAMVSLPDFDPTCAWTADLDSFRNRALTDQFEPGSVFKPFAAAIALDTGAVNTQEKIFCENGNYVGKGFGRIGEYRQGYGDLTVREILVHSSNIGMAKIGQRLGKDKLYEGLKFFGFGRKTGIDLPGEAEGLLRPTSQWTGYSVTRIPFGQEVSVTAIQLVQAFCILANGGHLVRPYLVKAMVDNSGEIVKLKQPPPPIGYIIKPEVAKWIVTEALTGVVNEGTGKKAKLEKWQVFGKTGTAQLANDEGGGYAENAYVASFIGGAPVENPAVIVLVSIFRPNVALGKGYTGGTVATPVAAAILEKTLNYLGIHNDIAVPKHGDFVRDSVHTKRGSFVNYVTSDKIQ